MPNMTRMPSLRRRSGLLTLLAAVVAAAWSLPALAQDEGAGWEAQGYEMTVQHPTKQEMSLLLSEIDNHDVWGTQKVREQSRADRDFVVEKGNGISVYEVLRQLARDTGYGYIEIPRPGRTPLSFDADDIRHPQRGPFFYLDDGVVRFFRPSTGPGDYNARDRFIVDEGMILKQTRSDLDVRVSPKEKKIEVGDSVTFTMKVVNGPSVPYKLSWNFDDGGAPAPGRTVTHEFTESGRYQVLATAEVADDPTTNGSAVANITVGDPKESSKDQDGGGSSTGTSDSGTYDGLGSTSSGTSSSTTTPSTPTPTPSFDSQTTPSIATAGPTISGNLLADVSTPAPSNILESAAKAAREGTPKDDEEADGATVPEAVLSIVALLVLLTLGAAMEERQDWRLRRAAKPVG